jgi:hypothetical protein
VVAIATLLSRGFVCRLRATITRLSNSLLSSNKYLVLWLLTSFVQLHIQFGPVGRFGRVGGGGELHEAEFILSVGATENG